MSRPGELDHLARDRAAKAEALAKARRHHPATVSLDRSLERVTGSLLAAEVKARARRARADAPPDGAPSLFAAL